MQPDLNSPPRRAQLDSTREPTSRTLFVGITSSYQEYSLCSSGLLLQLIDEAYHLVILTPDPQTQNRMRAYFDAAQATVIVWPELRCRSLLNHLHHLRTLKALPDMPKLRQQRVRDKLNTIWASGSWNKKARMVRNRLTARLLPSWAITQLEARLESNARVNELFTTYEPELTLLSWGGVYGICPEITRASKGHGCPTMSIDASWDNLDEEVIPHKLDKLLVWNEGMKLEAVKNHRYPAANVEVVGPIRCDIYRQRHLDLKRDEFLSRYGLDPQRKIVTLAINRGDAEIYLRTARALIHADKRGHLPQPIQLILRLPPGGKPRDYREFESHPNVHILKSFLSSQVDEPHGPISTEALSESVSMLQHTDLLISVLSTLILESLYSDTANISLKYPEFESLYQRDFIQPFLREKGVSHATSSEEVISMAIDLLTNPERESDERHHILEKYTTGGHGPSCKRTLDAILTTLRPK